MSNTPFLKAFDDPQRRRTQRERSRLSIVVIRDRLQHHRQIAERLLAIPLAAHVFASHSACARASPDSRQSPGARRPSRPRPAVASATRNPEAAPPFRLPPWPQRASRRPALRASNRLAPSASDAIASVGGTKIVGQVLHRMHGRPRKQPRRRVFDAEARREGEELTIPTAEIQKGRVEASGTREGDCAQNRFRILLVADPAREHDEELVGGQLQAQATRARSSASAGRNCSTSRRSRDRFHSARTTRRLRREYGPMARQRVARRPLMVASVRMSVLPSHHVTGPI